MNDTQRKPNDNPYSAFREDEMILRDYLALDRTILANERTFLAYVRTAMALFAAGATFVKFFDSLPLTVVGWLIIPLGIACLAWGIFRYRRVNERIRAVDSVPKGERPVYKAGGPV